MDEQTRSYRLAQISKLKRGKDSSSTIKMYGSYDGQTNCLNISVDEFTRICQILTEDEPKG